MPDWKNGWVVQGRSVIMGTIARCACCGKNQGVVCTVFPDDYNPPDKDPDWPFSEEDCPLHNEKLDARELSIDELAGLGESTIRRAMILIKTNGLN
jgi:hypothetical protein